MFKLKKNVIVTAAIITLTMLHFSDIKVLALNTSPLKSKEFSDLCTLSDQTFNIEMLSWEKAKKIIPMYEKFEIIDLKTGISFNVQRRAGRYHADVQPLTSKDTYLMKEIYGGSWSWDRRAILIHKDGHLIAASMHGMPHGAGAIQNDFPGHFCIHFLNSKTHRSKEVDLAHQLMVHRAAGQLESYLQHASANQIIDIFLVAVDQFDIDLLQLILLDQNQLSEMIAQIKNIEEIKRITPLLDSREILFKNEIIKVSLFSNKGGETKEMLNITLDRDILVGSWKIRSAHFNYLP